MSQLTEVIESYRRCMSRPGFFDRFYEILFSRDENIPPMFADVDFKKQKTMIRKAVTTVIMKNSGVQAANISLEAIAKTHGKSGLNVTPQMYAIWIESMIQAVTEMDSHYTPELGENWRKVLESGIGYIIEKSA